MKLKFLVSTLFVGLFSVSTAWAASCGSFSMTAGSSSTGTISCATSGSTASSGNITFIGNNVVREPSHSVIFSNVTNLTSSISGLTAGSGAFTVNSSVWDVWSTIYVALKQGNGFGLFLFTNAVNSGTWLTPNGRSGGVGTGLSHYIAFGGELKPPSAVPVPAAVWLFGSALAGLFGVRRQKQA